MEKKDFAEKEIDVLKIVRILWDNKSIVLSLTLSLMLAGYIYGKTLEVKTEYQSVIVVKYPNQALFVDFKEFVKEGEYKNEFDLHITSFDSLVDFAKSNKKIENFKSYLKKNNTNFEDYLKGKFFKIESTKNAYGLIYNEHLNGDEFLNDYIDYLRIISTSTVKSRIKKKLEIQIEDLKTNLDIARAINLEKPLAQSVINDNNIVFTYPPAESYYKGVIILKKKIQNLLKKKSDLLNNDFYFNPILDLAFIKHTQKSNYNKYVFIGFATGLLISMVIIFFRRVKKS